MRTGCNSAQCDLVEQGIQQRALFGGIFTRVVGVWGVQPLLAGVQKPQWHKKVIGRFGCDELRKPKFSETLSLVPYMPIDCYVLTYLGNRSHKAKKNW